MPEVDVNLYNDACSGSLTVRAIKRYPSHEAVVAGGQRVTYSEMGDEVSRLVQLFAAEGLSPGDGIALLTGNHVQGLFVLAAADVLGLRFTPLHPLGALDDFMFILNDAEIRALVVNARTHLATGEALRARVPGLSRFFIFDDSIEVEGAVSLRLAKDFEPQPLIARARPDRISKLIYTGGTSGRPKGVVLPERMWLNNMKQISAEFEWPNAVRFLATAPLSHAAIGMIAPTQVRGGSLVLLDGFRPVEFMETVQRERITATFLVPTMLYALLDHPQIDAFDLSSLQFIMVGAAPIAADRLSQALDRFGSVFAQFYGQTEGGVMSYLCTTDHDPSRIHLLRSCGIPMMGVDLRVLDENLVECAPGEVGELCARGPNIMAGYWKREEESAAALSGGWLHTGDLATRDEDGYLYVVGRAKDMIISGGFNVYPSEIEHILDAHPAVAASAVIGVPDAKWGEAVTAFLVVEAGCSVTEEECRILVREKKGPVHTPKHVHFVTELPLTALGKIDKKRLREPFWNAQAREVA